MEDWWHRTEEDAAVEVEPSDNASVSTKFTENFMKI